MQDIFDTMPPIDEAALERKLLDTVLLDDNYLFWRRHIAEDVGWPMESDPKDGEGWDTYCTRCKGRSYIRKKDTHPKARNVCPVCGANVKPKGWSGRHKKQTTRFLYYHFQRGAGRTVWLRALQCYHVFGEVGEEHATWNELAHYRFDDGIAEKYKYKFLPIGGWDLHKMKRVTTENWRISSYSYDFYPTYIEDDVDLKGSCLEYAMLPQVLEMERMPMVEYLALYAKHPRAVEALMKIGCSNLVQSKLNGQASAVNRVVNFRATTFKKLFRGGMHGQELRLLAGKSTDVLLCYRTLREAGAVQADAASAIYAEQVARLPSDIYAQNLERCGVRHKELRSYYERQARKSQAGIYETMLDHRDYLRQLDTLRIADGDWMPVNLPQSHARLSERIGALENAKKQREQDARNQLFRMRRRRLRWAQFYDHDFIIRPIDSQTELIREGEQNHNCVAGYAKRHTNGETAIFVLRRRLDAGTSFCTVEYDEKTNTIVQCRADRNGKAPEEAWAFCDKWLAHLQKTHFEKKPTRNNRRNAA